MLFGAAHASSQHSPAQWDSFQVRLCYVALDATRGADYPLLGQQLAADSVTMFYLAVSGMALNNARGVLKKPLGYDLHTPEAINDAVAEVFAEDQIYRIDHYLGMVSVQNLLAFDQAFKEKCADAYERLLLDVIRGNLSLFVRRDEQEAAWRWVEPLLNHWQNTPALPMSYQAGSWGPSASSAMLSRRCALAGRPVNKLAASTR